VPPSGDKSAKPDAPWSSTAAVSSSTHCSTDPPIQRPSPSRVAGRDFLPTDPVQTGGAAVDGSAHGTGGVPWVWKDSIVFSPQACPLARSACVQLTGRQSGARISRVSGLHSSTRLPPGS
jgi:hypothetical protein